jgi:hypothetical protein
VDKKNKTFTGTKHACTKDPNSNECLDRNAKWNPNAKDTHIFQGFAVIMYLKKLNSENRLPAMAIDAIRERGVFEEVDDSDDSYSGS